MSEKEFKIGDKVKVVNDQHIWLEDENGEQLPNNTTLTVIGERDGDYSPYTNFDDLTIEIEALRNYPEDFELVMSLCAVQSENFNQGELGWKLKLNDGGFVSGFGKQLIGEAGSEYVITNERAKELGIYRPNLEDRKVGKVRVELVDDGFPLALREISKVMTWAQTAKGYKDHDWQNLPNPEQGLAGAASRHRTDHIIQRMVGKSAAIECTDHESNLLHKAHEAFGVLAQLELILRGVIK